MLLPLQAILTDMLHANLLQKDMAQVYQEETGLHLFLQGGVPWEEKLTVLDLTSDLVSLTISWSRT